MFQKEYVDAFKNADRVVIANIFRPEAIPPEERLDVTAIANQLARSDVDAHFIPGTERILEFVLREIAANDVVLVMSNGSFDDLPHRLLEGIRKGKAG